MISSSAPSFTASQGWLDGWKNRHGTILTHISGEKMSPNQSVAGELVTTFIEAIKSNVFVPDQVCNMDEMGLNFKMLSNKTFSSGHESPIFARRITVGICSTASGTHKLPLFVIGKSAMPCAFKNFNISSLPVYHRSQNSARMNSSLFEEWVTLEFVLKVKAHLKSNNFPLKAGLPPVE